MEIKITNSSGFFVNKYVTQYTGRTMASMFTSKGQFELTHRSCHVISRSITLQQLCTVIQDSRDLFSFPSIKFIISLILSSIGDRIPISGFFSAISRFQRRVLGSCSLPGFGFEICGMFVRSMPPIRRSLA